jgi:hypothetical protein
MNPKAVLLLLLLIGISASTYFFTHEYDLSHPIATDASPSGGV